MVMQSPKCCPVPELYLIPWVPLWQSPPTFWPSWSSLKPLIELDESRKIACKQRGYRCNTWWRKINVNGIFVYSPRWNLFLKRLRSISGLLLKYAAWKYLMLMEYVVHASALDLILSMTFVALLTKLPYFNTNPCINFHWGLTNPWLGIWWPPSRTIRYEAR